MSSFVGAGLAWVRRLLGWCLSLEERLADMVLLAGGISLLAGAGVVWSLSSSQSITESQAATLWGVLLAVLAGWLVALAVFRQRGWLKIAGPLLFYDLLRIARRKRYFLLRSLYALLLGVLLCWVFLVWRLENQDHRGTRELARFAEQFFYTFLGLQFAIVCLLTPAYTAGAIAEEKDRKTLEFVLATDLRNREIVLSKFFSRVANLTLLLLTGLPILSFLQFVGGVDPNLVLAGFAGTALSMISLASLSIVNSVLTKKPRDAIALTYLGAAAYLILSGASWLLLLPNLGLAQLPSWSPIKVEDCVSWFSIGNPVAVVVQLMVALERGLNINVNLPTLLANYLLFHGLVTICCLIWAVARLRSLAMKQSYGQTQKLSVRARVKLRPRLGAHPMIWKEIFVESGLRFNMAMRVVLVLLILGSFVPVAFIVANFIDELRTAHTGFGRFRMYSNPWEEFARAMNIWVRILGSLVACLLLLAVAARAASSVSSERDRQTLDALLTSPLDSNTMLFAKWLGNILSVRWAWIWLGAIYALGLVTGGLHLLALPLLVGAWLIYAAVVSGIGVWFSIVSRTTLRATIWTLMTTAGAGMGHWLIWMCCIPLMIRLREEPALLKWVRNFQVGFSPPIAMGLGLPFCQQDFNDQYHGSPEQWELIGFALLGLFCWAVIAGCLWTVSSTRFRLVTGRLPYRRPPRSGAWEQPAASKMRDSLEAAQQQQGLHGATLVEEPWPDDADGQPAK